MPRESIIANTLCPACGSERKRFGHSTIVCPSCDPKLFDLLLADNEDQDEEDDDDQ